MGRLLRAAAITLALALLFVGGSVAGIVSAYSRNLPDISRMADYQPARSTRIYARDGSLLATLYKENRIWVPIDKIPPMVRDAFIANEDHNFYRHHGVDFGGIVRAAFSDLTHHHIEQGASTITQQLARGLFLTDQQTISRKIQEALLAMEIERYYTKDEILERYLQFSRPSYYETLLALAFVHFAREHVDAAVIEVGVGGKLDGTNVLRRPRVSVITNVGLDHMDILGDTVELIAADKAGIARAGVPLVSAVDHPGARAVIEAHCRENGTPFVSVLDVTTIEQRESSPYAQSFALRTPVQTYDLTLPVLGTFQQVNAATAVVALEQLDGDLRPSRDAVERGLSRFNLAGRMEYFPSHPGVLFDVAHNPDKASHLVDSLKTAFPDRRFTCVIAVGESKDAHEILHAFVDLPAHYIFTGFQTQGRTATKPQRLLSIAESLGMSGRAIADPIEALSLARRNTAAHDIVVITGSTFVVAELRDWWMEHVVATESAR